MSSQAVAMATLTYQGYGACSVCHGLNSIYMLSVSLVTERLRIESVKACTSCLEGVSPNLGIQLSDVMKINTKSQKRMINKTARKRERACAEEIGGKTTPASGSGISKGDARNEHLVLDDKYTAARQFTLKEADITNLITEAKRTGRMGAMKIGFRVGKSNVAVLDWDDFLELTNGSS